ncbi:putative ferric-chelate reductase 1 isoform X2 [Rana temporaria]|nr:putative ferric-chelate reductase 1 isoform X2 [Rana temporaria]
MSPAIQSFALIFLAWFSVGVDAYGNGLVTAACSSMMPQHGASAQTSSSPYILTLSKTTYSPGEKITATLTSSSGSTQFKGFLIQARSASDTTPWGSFQVTSDAQTLTCTTAADSVSHASSSRKTSLQVTWIAPTSTTANIQIRATVVQTESVFWTNVNSPTLSYMAVPSNTASSTASTTTTTSATTTTAISGSTTTTSSTSSSTLNNGASVTKTTSINNNQSSGGSQLCIQNFQAFLLFCLVVVVSFLVQ